MPANAPWKWPSAAWDSPPAPTTASSRWRAPSPISADRTSSPPSTSPKPCSIAASTAITGPDTGACDGCIMSIMDATTLISVEEYLSSVYDPDMDYVDGELEDRSVGEKDHAKLQ